MSKLAQVIGRQIEELRLSKGLGKTEMAKLLGVTRQTLDNYIKGKQIIDSGKLALLAREFSKSMDFFLASNTDKHPSLMFRAESASNTSSEIIDAIIRRFELYLDLLKNIKRKSIFDPPAYSIRIDKQHKLTEGDKREIEKIAAKCRQALSLDGITGEDLFVALEDAGINIIAFPTDPDAAVWGASAYSLESGAFIYVNDHKSIPEERKIFSLIHELGHLILHRDKYSSSHSELKYVSKRKDLSEKVADHFAGSFLLPRSKINHEWIDKGFSLSDLFHLKRKYKISLQAVIMTLSNYNYISKAEHKKLFAFLNAKGYQKNEPEPLPYFEKNHQIYYYLKKLYFDGHIGLNKVAEYLGISLIEARVWL